MGTRRWIGRAFDVLALALLAFAVYRVVIAPRLLGSASASRPAPPVRLAQLGGGTFTLAEHRGRVVFLDFWASWCEPCKVSLPLVERFARAHPDVDVIPVDAGEAPAIAAAFARAHNMRNVVFDPDLAAVGAFHVNGYPTMIVIDPKGQIRGSWPGLNPLIESAMSNAAKHLRSG